jgi:F420-dependent oxidoreductase-like protein
MRLGVNVPPEDPGHTARLAEQLGYDVAFVPEGYRSDAVSVLGHLAAVTERIGLASGVLQIPGRTPAMTTLTAATLDTLSGGRFRLGLGISNAQITSGWHGLPYRDPLARTGEFVTVVRAALAGEQISHRGRHYRIPLGDEYSGFRLPGPARSVPVYLAAVGPASLELAGRIADGWFGVFATPEFVRDARGRLAAGRVAAGVRGAPLAGYQVMVSTPIVVDEDPQRAAAPVRAYVARFVSLGHREGNVYYRLMAALGHAEEAARIQDLMAAGEPARAAAAVPWEFLDRTALLGPPDRIAARLREYAGAGVTTLALSPFAADPGQRDEALRVAAAAATTSSPFDQEPVATRSA